MLRRSVFLTLSLLLGLGQAAAQTMESRDWKFSGARLVPIDALTRAPMPPITTNDIDRAAVTIVSEDDGTGYVRLRLDQQNGLEILVKPSSLLVGEACRKVSAAPRPGDPNARAAAGMGVGGDEACLPSRALLAAATSPWPCCWPAAAAATAPRRAAAGNCRAR